MAMASLERTNGETMSEHTVHPRSEPTIHRGARRITDSKAHAKRMVVAAGTACGGTRSSLCGHRTHERSGEISDGHHAFLDESADANVIGTVTQESCRFPTPLAVRFGATVETIRCLHSSVLFAQANSGSLVALAGNTSKPANPKTTAILNSAREISEAGRIAVLLHAHWLSASRRRQAKRAR
jgi:hypothetical protein